MNMIYTPSTVNTSRTKNHIKTPKNPKFPTTSGCKVLKYKKSEFKAKTQLLLEKMYL